MRIFVTGATGFVGSAVVRELVTAGHQVLGLARSEDGTRALSALGAEVHRGDIEDLPNLRRGAAKAEGVIHTAFNHDFSKFAVNCEADRLAIEALGSELAGSNRPLIVTSGVGHSASGRLRTEDDPPHPSSARMPRASEEAAANVQARGVRVMVVRLPQVHDPVKQGLITPAVAIAREKGVSAYVGEGQNRWPAAHVLDVARLYRLAFERREAGARYHAVAEEGIKARDIAEVVGQGLKMPVVSLSPEEAPAHFGWLAAFVGLDMPASSKQTRQRLGWQPQGPGLLEDLRKMQF